jgi:hypothetical protein
VTTLRALAVFLACIASSAFAAGLAPGFNDLKVELPAELRTMAGRGEVSPVTHALVTVAAPADFRPEDSRPVFVVSATSDRPWHSSRELMREYAGVALAHGWILVAADPAPAVTLAEDHTSLRVALNIAALAALRRQWPKGETAPLAFGGFSGGSKYTGWLAAAFASRGRTVIGVYQSGCNEDALLEAARHFGVLDVRFRKIPVFLQSGADDRVATPADHRRIASELTGAGFRNVRIASPPGGHEVTPATLGDALDWFEALARN